MTVGDTSYFIDLMHEDRPDHSAAHEVARTHVEEGRPLYMTAMTRFELFTGSERYTEPIEERSRIQGLLDRYESLPLAPESADRAGKIHGRLAADGRTIGAIDALIAGIALEHDQRLLTRNVDEFERVQGLKVETY